MRRRFLRKSVTILVAAVIAAGSLAGCTSQPAANQTQGTESKAVTEGSTTDQKTEAAGRTDINVAISAEPDNLDVSKNMDEGKSMIGQNVQETLLALTEQGELRAAGAESWEISEDGLIYTFHLRENHYSDGTPVKAADYANTLLRTLDPATASQYAAFYAPVAGAEEFSAGTGTREDVAIKALDDKTLELTLKEAVPYFIQMFTMVDSSPIPSANTEGDKTLTYGSSKESMSYSGPFYIDQWNRGSGLVLKKNPHYWDQASVKLETVNLILAADINTRQQMFEQGQIDLLESVNSEYLNRAQEKIDNQEIRMYPVEKPTVMYICFNNEDPEGIFSNANIRKAFSLAIDRQIFVDKVLRANAPAKGIIPPVMGIGDENFRAVVAEPLLALESEDPKALLEKGLEEIGRAGETIEVTYLQKNSENDTKVQAEFFQNQWQEKLGVIVKVDAAADSPTFNTTVQKGMYQLCLTGWGADYNDPMTFMLQYATGGNNPAFCSNETYDQLIKDCTTETDMKVRREKFAEAEKIVVADEAFIAPIYYTQKKHLLAAELEGIAFTMNKPIDFKNAYFK